MTMLKMLIKLGFAAMLIELAMAANHTVGGPNGGWDTSSNVQTWASSQSFTVGDNLIFQYSATHDVAEVSKQDYDSCQASSAISSYSDGNTVIALSSPGKRYFICGTPGHCRSGMKVEIDTLATATPTPSPSPSPASPANPPLAATPVTPTASPAPETSPNSVTPNPSPAPETTTSLPDVPATASPPPASPPPPTSGARDSFRVNLTTGMGGLVLMMMMLLAF